MKICSKCKEEKTRDNFSKKSSAKDGLYNYCKVCSSAAARLWNSENKDKRSVNHARFKSNNPDYFNTRSAIWRKNNRERCKVSAHNWHIANRAKVNSKDAKRRATKLNATPSWLTEEHHKQIADMYWLAKDLEAVSGQTYHVDHIVPLQGSNVCGLHVPWNLQVLPADINIGKSNKHVA